MIAGRLTQHLFFSAKFLSLPEQIKLRYMKVKIKSTVLFSLLAIVFSDHSQACTGIALKAEDGSKVVARTVEWAASPMNCGYAVVPRGYRQQSLTPDGMDGMCYKARFGYVGIYTEYDNFVVEGVNEAGLSAGLFFFPGYGEYPEYKADEKASCISDMQLVTWILSSFDSIDALKEGICSVKVVSLDPRVGTVHWRISEAGGRVVVLEYKDGKACFYENPLGVLTNSPGFEWHITNLANYVNLHPGAAESFSMAEGLTVKPLGGGSAMLGLPGDFTPPSRFIRAAFFSASAPVWPDAFSTVLQAFHILNNFDIPIGAQFSDGNVPEGLPAATQFTSATDLANLKFYYRTCWNSNLRCIDLKTIDFRKVKYRSVPLDEPRVQEVEFLKIK